MMVPKYYNITHITPLVIKLQIITYCRYNCGSNQNYCTV